MADHDDVFIEGEWRRAHSGARLMVRNPASEEAWASVPDGDAQDVDAAVAAARRARSGWRATAPGRRAELLRNLARELEAHADELARLTTTENGTPIAETAGAGPYSAAHLRVVAALAEDLEREDVRQNPVAPTRALVERAPLGVAALITPWNFPLALIVAKLAPALLAGCTTVVKPAPETPMAARLLMDLVAAAGLPPGTVNLVTGGPETGRILVAHPGVDKVSFTGSTAAGREIGRICGGLLRPATLELGGKSAAVVLDDVDLEALRRNIVKVSLRNTGQTCKASTRLVVPRSRRDEIVEAVAEVVASAPMGDPFDPATVFGPLVSARQRDRVAGYIEAGVAEGARPVVGGTARTRFERGYYVQPTVFTDVDAGMRVVREEIFGPVLVVQEYDDVDDAVRIANDSEYGLAGAVFGVDEDRALAVARRIDTGTIGINHYGSNPVAPFSGHKASGIGVEFGPEGLAGYLGYTSLHLLNV
jgi:aldehyde dehydrogenase (NAD+)